MPCILFIEKYFWGNMWYLMGTTDFTVKLSFVDASYLFIEYNYSVYKIIHGIHNIPYLHSERF